MPNLFQEVVTTRRSSDIRLRSRSTFQYTVYIPNKNTDESIYCYQQYFLNIFIKQSFLFLILCFINNFFNLILLFALKKFIFIYRV